MQEHQTEQSYHVTVEVEGNPDYTFIVQASREGIAQTRAMLEYPYPLEGQLVTYTMKRACVHGSPRPWDCSQCHELRLAALRDLAVREYEDYEATRDHSGDCTHGLPSNDCRQCHDGGVTPIEGKLTS
jgi:hypothetical protein